MDRRKFLTFLIIFFVEKIFNPDALALRELSNARQKAFGFQKGKSGDFLL
jgi:hypothetical protein